MKKPQHRRAKPKAKRTPSESPSAARGRLASGRASKLSGMAAMGRAGRVVAHRRSPVSGFVDAGFSRARAVFDGFGRQVRITAAATTMAPEDRQIAVFLLMPFLILVMAIAGNQSLRLSRHLEALIARPVQPLVLPSTEGRLHAVARAPAPVAMPEPVPVTTPVGALSPRVVASESLADRLPERTLPPSKAAAEAILSSAPRTLLAEQPAKGRAIVASKSGIELQPVGQPVAMVASRSVETARAADVSVVAGVGTQQIASLSLVPLQLPGLHAYEDGERWRSRRASLDDRCVVPGGQGAGSERARAGAVASPAIARDLITGFGERLAVAGRKQLDDLVIYDDAYRSISYPLGDVPKLYGVCTDVVIRAYRAVGVDLQVEVQKARVGSGDRNIDHRRTETLRRFFQTAGESLPVTSFAEDYLAGDIVTYARPQNTGTSSRSHIALVSDVIAPSGRPMILHNRGWGPQLEDALFVDQITGHYRYDGRRGVTAQVTSTAGDVDPMPVQLRPVGLRRTLGAQSEKSQTATGTQRRRTSNALDLSSSGKTAHR